MTPFFIFHQTHDTTRHTLAANAIGIKIRVPQPERILTVVPFEHASSG